MANKEHLDLIKQGIEVWNKWRIENTDEIPDLSRAFLVGVDLRGANLSRADLIEADLSGANLKKTILILANLRRANLSGANLKGANLKTSDVTVDQLVEAKTLYKAKLLPSTETELREKHPERYKELIKQTE